MSKSNPSKIASPTAAAEKWMAEAIKHHGEFKRLFQMTKDRALSCGFYFLMAKNSVPHGEWQPFLERYAEHIAARTVRVYMEFAEEALAWARVANPKVLGNDKLLPVARDMVMQSPKAFVNLCRDLKLMRKFGEYDEVKYRKKKLKSAQMEFDFALVMPAIEQLSHLSDKDCIFKLPEDMAETDFFADVETKLERALAQVRAFIKSRVTDI